MCQLCKTRRRRRAHRRLAVPCSASVGVDKFGVDELNSSEETEDESQFHGWPKGERCCTRDARNVGRAPHECGGTLEPQSTRWTLRDDVSQQILAESGPYAPGGLLVS